MLDGTYTNGWCVLIAYTGTHVIDWQWCDHEKTASWTALISTIPAPRYAIVDGNGPLTTTIERLWSQTRIQRCYFHIQHACNTHLTRTPTLPANKELQAIYRALSKVQTWDQAAAWLAEFATWEAKWDRMLKQRTYARSSTSRPAHVRPGQTWWYTHLRTRRAHGFLAKLIAKNHLFTWLEAADEGVVIAKTTNALEGGINAGIKHLKRHHRGLSEDHGRRAVDWYLWDRTQAHSDPWTLAKSQLKTLATTPLKEPVAEPVGPAVYDTGFSWEDGIGIQSGWGGRRR